MHLNGEKRFYEAETTEDHVHLACFRCGRIEKFTAPVFDQLRSEIARHNGFQIRVIRLEAGGLCRLCAAQEWKNKRK